MTTGGARSDVAATVYLWLAALFVSALLVADITGVKLFELRLGGLTLRHTAGMLTFPVTFLLTDLLNEFYGARAARRVVWLALAMGLFAFGAVNAALALPRWEAPFNLPDGAFEAVFGNARVMYVASLAAFLVGSLLDIAVFGRLKRWSGGRFVWLRATGSTVVSQALDSFVVTWLAFSVGRTLFPTDAAAMPLPDVLATAATGYTLKFALALALTPLVYLGRFALTRGLGLQPLPADRPRPSA